MTNIGEACEVCGYVSHLGAVARHHLIPKDVTEQAGMPKSETVSLCCNCHFELYAWYRMKVADMFYDTATKRFRAKSWDKRLKTTNLPLRPLRSIRMNREKSVKEGRHNAR